MKQTLKRGYRQVYLARRLSDGSWFEMIVARNGRVKEYKGDAELALKDTQAKDHPIARAIRCSRRLV